MHKKVIWTNMDPLQLVILAVVLFALSFVVSNLGIGGGTIYVPLLMIITGYEMKQVVPFSLLFGMSTNIMAAVNHYREGLVLLPAVGAVLLSAVFGSVIGARFTLTAAQVIVQFIFVAVIVLVIIKMADKTLTKQFIKRKKKGGEERDGITPFDIKKCWPFLLIVVIVSFGTGFLSGSLGIGGGVVTVPLLVMVLGLDTRKAIGTSATVIPFLAAIGASVYFLGDITSPLGMDLPFVAEVELDYWLLLMLPVVLIGGFVGSKVGLKFIKTFYIELTFVVLMFIVMSSMLVKTLQLL